jgi:transposase
VTPHHPPVVSQRVAQQLGINEGTLGNWVNKYRADHPASEELDITDRARLRELERENRDLRMEREFLKKAAAFFAKEQQ